MSLNKKLWLAITYMLILSAGGCFALSTLFSKHYLEEQLQVKNSDNATALALSISQLDKDAATLNLLISAQFDAGHYQYIGLFNPMGKMMIERVNKISTTKAPNWFIKVLPIKTQAGIADIQDGWSQFGTLKLESDLNAAYDTLWKSTLLIALWSIAIGLMSCYVGSQILQKTLRPLNDIVEQAKAIGEHRFITIAEPQTTEFKAVVSAMNSLSNRTKKTLSEESARLEKLRYQTNFDAISGLMNHDFFISTMHASVSRKEYFNKGVLVVCKLTNLHAIDQRLGYTDTNAFIKLIGQTLDNICLQAALIAGRLNGSNFAVFSEATHEPYALGNQIKSALQKLHVSSHIDLQANFVTVAIQVEKSDSPMQLVTRIGNLVDEISLKNSEDILHVIDQAAISSDLDATHNEWKTALVRALADKRIKLQHYPLINMQGELIHYESPVRLQLQDSGKWLSAGEFIVWATQLNLMPRVDALVVETAMQLLSNRAAPIGLNISAETMLDASFTKKTMQLIKANLSVANRLYIEVPERGVFEHFSAFKDFCKQLKSLGCKVGIEHVGSRIARLGELHDVGLDYIKFDAAIISDIDSNEANKTLLRGLCMITHSIGALAFAEGVNTTAEIETLKLIGMDGMTGPGIQVTT